MYAKVKLESWGVQTEKPTIWLTTAIKKGDRETDFAGKTLAEVQNIKYYPYYMDNKDQFNIFLTLKIVTPYKRSPLVIGAPIALILANTQVYGTIIDLSSKPFNDKYLEKTIYFVKRNSYPGEYEAIKIGDSYFDGTRTAFEILEKSGPENITVKAKISLQEKNGELVFGEEQVIKPGKLLNLSTLNFAFNDFVVGKIE